MLMPALFLPMGNFELGDLSPVKLNRELEVALAGCGAAGARGAVFGGGRAHVLVKVLGGEDERREVTTSRWW